MIDHTLRIALCHSATRRAHLAGAEAGDAARRRYWRETAAVALLSGRRWPEAEALGVEPAAPVSTSQED
jgi:hypothetical protein